MNKHYFYLTFLFLCAPVFIFAATESTNACIPYRLLWHSYKMSSLSFEKGDRAKVSSKAGVSPSAFRFTPISGNGEAPVSCDSNGVITVLWLPEFEQNNSLIYVNQPKGSMDFQFGWNFNANFSEPLEFHLLLNWRRYVEASYHWLNLQPDL